MSALDLKSNILELACRTCLKMSKSRYNIFADSYNSKLISELIMECTLIKVAKSDGFPANICSICLEKLNVVYDFKTMVVQSDLELRRCFERSGLEIGVKPRNQNKDEMSIKEEGFVVKSELFECICNQENKSDMLNNINDVYTINNIYNNLFDLRNEQIKQEDQQIESCDDGESERILSECKSTHHAIKLDCSEDSCQRYTCSDVSMDEFKDVMKKETLKVNSVNNQAFDLRNERIKQEDHQVRSCDDGESEQMLSEYKSTIKIECSEDSSHRHICSEVSIDEFKGATTEETLKVNDINDGPFDLRNELIKQEDQHVRSCDHSESEQILLDYEDTSKEPAEQIDVIESDIDVSNVTEESHKSVIIKRKRKGKNTKLNSPRDVNKKQVELLDNADYKRIMAMKISRKEKLNLPIFCPDCNKTFTFHYFVGVHAHLHTGNLPFKCDKCDTRFPKRPMLKVHLLTHVETRDLACDECGKAFSRISSLRTHKVSHSTDRPYKCDTCGKAFKRSVLLHKHQRIHSNKRDHICEVCGKGFIRLGDLNNHKVIHQTGNQKLPCRLCGKEFCSKRKLQIHVKRHSEEKRHVCDQCRKSFHSRALLQQHILVHTGEKPFSCDICDKKFRQKGHLLQHVRIHTGETPYPCKICPSKFKYSHSLLGHMKVHDKELVKREMEQKD